MESTEKRRGGRPRTREEIPRSGAYIGFRSTDELKQKLEDAGAIRDRSLSGETRHRVEATFRDEDALGQAMVLAFGEDNAGLVQLTAEVLRVFAPRGQWRDDPAVGRSVLRGIARLLDRLRATDDVIHDDSPESRVDELLWTLGDDGTDHHGELTYMQRWAAEKRSRLGSLGPLLVEMRRTVRQAAEAMPARERPAADPEAVENMVAALAQVRAAPDDAHSARVRVLLERASDPAMADAREDNLRAAGELVDWIARQPGADAQAVAALRRDLDGASGE